MSKFPSGLALLWLLVAAFCGETVLALDRSEVALICNKRVPASLELARFYAKARSIPDDHIIEMDLPDTEQMGQERFDPDLVVPLRRILNERGLKEKIKCLVTFYGVPLKLTPRVNTPAEAEELTHLKETPKAIDEQIKGVVVALEKQVHAADENFTAGTGEDLSSLTRRADAAFQAGGMILSSPVVGSNVQNTILTAMLDAVRQLSGEAGIVQRTKPRDPVPLNGTGEIKPSAAMLEWEAMRQRVADAQTHAAELMSRIYEPSARSELRELTATTWGLLETLRLVQLQTDYLSPQGTNALDSELALLWVYTHPYKGFIENYLHYRHPARQRTQALMVMRLDAPQSGIVRDMILAGKAVELKGALEGTFVIDSRGLPAKKGDGLALYDQRLRDLTDLVRGKTKLNVLSDDTPELIPAHFAKNVSLYCGWYSVRNYVPSCDFVPGAVGFHIASYEMVSLRNPNEKGWCRGQLNDGIAATLGAVDEPFLGTFPDPVDYFGLLLTGKYTLAEVYWMTSPAVYWKITAIGDPLYNPFARKPALSITDLPVPLRNALQ